MAANASWAVEAHATNLEVEDAKTVLDYRRTPRFLPGIVSNSATLRRVLGLVRVVAPAGAAVLIHGETGTGREPIAEAIVLSRALRLVRRAIDDGRAALRGLHTASPSPSSLEQAFSILLSEVTTGRGLRLRIFVQGKPRALNPAFQEQLFLIGREAVMNALSHSKASKIEVEVQYLPELLRVFVRDNGCGINPEAVQNESDSHWGLRGMRERAENIGARFGISSGPGVGTEVRVAVGVDVAKRTTQDRGPWERRSAI